MSCIRDQPKYFIRSVSVDFEGNLIQNHFDNSHDCSLLGEISVQYNQNISNSLELSGEDDSHQCGALPDEEHFSDLSSLMSALLRRVSVQH